jgi:amino acid permease
MQTTQRSSILAAVLVVGMLVSSADERLGSDSGTAATSPFVIAAGDAGIDVRRNIFGAWPLIARPYKVLVPARIL